jgi:MoxR-like ATPase
MFKANQLKFLEAATRAFGAQAVIPAKDITEFAVKNGFSNAEHGWIFKPEYRAGRAQYKLPGMTTQELSVPAVSDTESLAAMAADIVPIRRETPVTTKKFDPNAISEHDYAAVPAKDKNYVPFGEFKMVEKIVASGKFFPLFISGHSGNGKTFMVEQVCAKVKRPMIRVQMSRETDEDDLIGGFRLINGETKFMKGPVLRAMEIGALLLIDEADRADPGKAMCLQGILEGKPYFMKKTGEIITAVAGFNVIVTANTKGRGSDDGRYVAATMLDDAWLERFPITIEQEYPTQAIEKRILTNYLSDTIMTEDDKSLVEHLTVWSEIIRKTFNEGAIDELISTRRLVHIAQTYRMIGDRMKAIRLCINRFDEETKTAFLDLYAKVDPTINPVTEAPATEVATEKTQEVSF